MSNAFDKSRKTPRTSREGLASKARFRHVKQSTTKTVINTISARSSELELQSNNLIKPKAVKSTVKKILPDYV